MLEYFVQFLNLGWHISGQTYEAGNTKLTIFNKGTAPLEESNFTVMLQLTGAGSGDGRLGLDLVAVLDISGSMKGEKLDKMKIAMQFVIKKLSSSDRLSIVTFADEAEILCPLRRINENSKEEIENLVNSLVANYTTNMVGGLEMGLKVLKERKFTSRRMEAILLMSDGEQNPGTDAAQVTVGKIPVHTFGFGADQDAIVCGNNS